MTLHSCMFCICTCMSIACRIELRSMTRRGHGMLQGDVMMLSSVPSMSSGFDHGLWSCLSSGNGQVMGSIPGMHGIA